MSFNPHPTPRRPAPHSSTTSANSRFRSSLVPMHRATPARSSQSSRVVAAAPATPAHDLFRTTTPKPSRNTQFAPNIPASATKAPASMRKFAPKGTGAGLAGTTSQELFTLRIPSPDPELTGAAMAKAVPDNMSRKGTIYADQYLAHKCPPEFNDEQRRQFFCILDLRRLKFAANEIFIKKDWKLNILNFSKEYEKSRSLIMLRYGLYEFKNVKPSEEIMRKWRRTHGLPDLPEPEKATATSGANSTTGVSNSSKRKATELDPKDNTLQASTANQNKRRNVEQAPSDGIAKFAPSPVKGKRKADEAEEVDDQLPNKHQRGTPSAARSRLEGIINSVQSSSSTPAGSPIKRPAFVSGTSASMNTTTTPLFGISKSVDASKSTFASKANPYGPPSNGVVDSSKSHTNPFQSGKSINGATAGSVLATHKIGAALGTKSSNIFGYLSESSANNSGAENGNDDADAETDSDSASQPEAESQDAAPSYEPSAAASTGTATPPITGLSGQPLFNIKPAPNTSNPFASAFSKPSEKPAEKPAGIAAKGGLFDRVSFGSNGQPLREASVEATSKTIPASKDTNSDTDQTKTPAKPPGDFTFNAATTPISFSQGSFPSKASVEPTKDKSLDTPQEPEKTPSGTSSSVFPIPPPSTSNTAPATQPLFGAKSAEQLAGTTEKSSQPLFSDSKKATETTTGDALPSTNLFASAKSADQSDKPTQPFQSLFGTKPSEQPSGITPQPSQPLFGAVKEKPEEVKPATTSTSSIFNSAPQPATSLFSFGTTPTPTSKPAAVEISKSSETDAAGAPEPPKFSFGSQSATNGTTMVSNEGQGSGIFSSQAPFGAPNTTSGTSASAAQSTFGGFKPSVEPPKPVSNIFGNTAPAPSPNFFGGSNTNTGSNMFGNSSPNPFGAANATASAKRSAEEDIHPSKKTVFGKSDPDNGPSQSAPPPMFFGSAQPSDDQAEKKSFLSGVTGNATPRAGSPVPGRKILTPKRLQKPGQRGQSPAPSAQSSFGDSNMFSSNAPQQEVALSGNSFGGNASFTFGAQNSAPVTNQTPSSSFTFGQSNTQTNGSAAGSSAFNFGGGSAAPNPGSFTFGAAGDGQSNPFAGTSGPPTQSFGVPGTPTPAGSFNFQFGGQGPSTPAPADQPKPLFGDQANGATPAPTFSFTSATPQQSSSNLFAAKPAVTNLFGSLQPGNGAPGANSPFPAPSSIATTPVNGTPEPQAQEDPDAEAPQEQLSLTEGGPGEEDEEVLHDVRAKATKYVPVVKGAEDSPASKSPWKTQGVGPLRLLKNKTTGTVRILLRAEPRGHIALNKTLLSGVSYKADGKTVKVMTSNDDGSGLETWVLQVKKPESASELAAAMETHKAANK